MARQKIERAKKEKETTEKVSRGKKKRDCQRPRANARQKETNKEKGPGNKRTALNNVKRWDGNENVKERPKRSCDVP